MIKRDNYSNLIHSFYNKKIINSVRKSEKSTLLLHLIEDLKSNGIEDNQIIHLKLDLVERQFELFYISLINIQNTSYPWIKSIFQKKG